MDHMKNCRKFNRRGCMYKECHGVSCPDYSEEIASQKSPDLNGLAAPAGSQASQLNPGNEIMFFLADAIQCDNAEDYKYSMALVAMKYKAKWQKLVA